jgi:flagellar biosynthesis anti-sigma factor FlgM
MKVTQKGPADAEISQLIKNEKGVNPVRNREGYEAEATGESTKVSISAAARDLQKVAALAKIGDDLRAEKVNVIREQIKSGEYHVEAEEVAKNIVRSEIARLLGT